MGIQFFLVKNRELKLIRDNFWLNYEIIEVSGKINPHFALLALYYMNKKAVTISPSQLIGFLD